MLRNLPAILDKNHQHYSSAGCRSILCRNAQKICEYVLHAVMQMAAILGRAEELKGEEETSIFGDDILMGSQRRGLLWAPLLRWQHWRNLQETSSRQCQSQMNKQKEPYFGVLELHYIQYILANPSGRNVKKGLSCRLSSYFV